MNANFYDYSVDICNGFSEEDFCGQFINLIFDVLDMGMSNKELAACLGTTDRNLRRWKYGDIVPKASCFLLLCELHTKMSES